MKKWILCLAIQTTALCSIEISKEPVAICYNPNSILERGYQNYAQFVENRTRLSTCTGVAWFPDAKQLISANLLQSSFQSYIFDPQNMRLIPNKFWKNQEVTQLGWPENLSVSKDGKWLAVSNSYTGKATLYRFSSKRPKFNPAPAAVISIGDRGLHGIRFSSRGNYLAYVTYEGPPKIRIFRIASKDEETPRFELAYTFSSSFEGMAPKGLDFSSDDRYLGICFSKRAGSGAESRSGRIAIYRFDEELGSFDPAPISEIGIEEGLDVPEDLLFYPDNSCILASNQGNDSVTLHPFDLETGMIGSSRIALQSPQAQLNFPHGIALSPDGKYLAVSNYGDDKVAIFAISNQ